MARGRPKSPLLSQADIVSEALRIVGAGTEPTLGRIATELGVHVSSLYNHVENRAHLVNLLRQRVSAEHPPTPLPADDWAAAISLVGHHMRNLLLAYPPLLAGFASSPVDPDAGKPYFDSFRAVMTSAGFSSSVVEQTLGHLDFLSMGSALDLTYELPSTDNEETFQFGLERFIAGLEALRTQR